MPGRIRQTVRYVHTSDGLRLAWGESGSGPPLVRAATWLTHLEFDLDSPVWTHWMSFFSDHFRFIRYDERGCGMSDWDVKDISLDRRVADLETVVEAAGLNEPFTLLGISQGASVSLSYAVRHPGRVARIVLCGGYARGALKRGDADARRMYEAITDLASLWGSDNPAFRQMLTSLFMPDATAEQMRSFNDMQRITTSPENAARLRQSVDEIDVTELLARVNVPTLVLHSRNDAMQPFDEGRRIATGIRGARFVALESRNHMILQSDPVWSRFFDEIKHFLNS